MKWNHRGGWKCLRIFLLILGGQAGFWQSSTRAETPREGTDRSAPFPVSIRVDAATTKGELRPIWRFFGYDEPNFTYMKDGRKLLTELSQIGPGPVFIRTHHLLTSGDGVPALKWGSSGVYTESPDGSAVYNWAILDRIFDTYRERNLKPFVEIG